MAKSAINLAAVVRSAWLPAGTATTPDGLWPLLPCDGRHFLLSTPFSGQAIFAGASRVFAQRHDRSTNDATSSAGWSDRPSPATGTNPVSKAVSAGYFVVEIFTLCCFKPQLRTQAASRNSRSSQGANSDALVSTTAVLQRHQYHAETNHCRTFRNHFLREMHYG